MSKQIRSNKNNVSVNAALYFLRNAKNKGCYIFDENVYQSFYLSGKYRYMDEQDKFKDYPSHKKNTKNC